MAPSSLHSLDYEVLTAYTTRREDLRIYFFNTTSASNTLSSQTIKYAGDTQDAIVRVQVNSARPSYFHTYVLFWVEGVV